MYRCLKECKIFTGVSETYLNTLSSQENIVTIAKGEFLFHKNDTGDGMYIVLEGSLDVMLEAENHVLATVGTGSIIGEINILTQQKRSASVMAQEACKLLFIGTKAFQTQIDAADKNALRIGYNMAYTLAERLQKTDEMILALQACPESKQIKHEMAIVRERLLSDVLL